MGDKYIIELEDKPFHKEDGDFLYRAKGFNSLVFDMTGISKLTSYTEPDLERVKKTAHDDGYSAGYQAGREDLNRVMSDIEQVKADAYLKGLNDGQGVIFASTQNNAFNNGYKKCSEDMELVRKEEYEKGFDAGRMLNTDKYEKGLADAWDAARKIVNMTWEERHKIFGKDIVLLEGIFLYNTAAEAIEKIRQYEQEQEKKEKHHTWICSEAGEPSTDITLICSKCGYAITLKLGDTQVLNFCPKCGDDKRGEQE